MPIFEYVCEVCGYECEKIQKNIQEADHITKVPVCQHGDEKALENDTASYMVRKKISTKTSFILKGGGWYKTDYGKK